MTREEGDHYKAASELLEIMMEADGREEWSILPMVERRGQQVLINLIASAIPPPRIFNHGRDSIVFTWNYPG